MNKWTMADQKRANKMMHKIMNGKASNREIDAYADMCAKRKAFRDEKEADYDFNDPVDVHLFQSKFPQLKE